MLSAVGAPARSRSLEMKVCWSNSQNGNFYSNDHDQCIITYKIHWFQISFKLVKPFGRKTRLRIILQLPIVYRLSCVCVMVTITSHIFINIVQTVHFSAVKFTRSNEKNKLFFFGYPNLWKFKKNLKQSDRAPLILIMNIIVC